MWIAERKQSKYVCPIVGVDKCGRPSLVGSGVLLKLGNRHFLFTAAHVLDESKSSTLYFAGNDDLIELIAAKSFRTSAPSGNRKDDKYDIAYLELDEQYVAQSSRYGFLSGASVDPNDLPNSRKFYSYIGFPHSKASVIPDVRKFKPKMYSYSSNSPSEALYALLGFSTLTHVLVNFDKERVKAYDGQILTFPDPWGMSGGGVWRLADLSKLSSRSFEPALVGIAIEYHKDQKILAATKIAFVLESVRKQWPELSDRIPRCEILKINVN
jgi:hypothetical protein